MAYPFPPIDWLDWTPEEHAVDAAATALHFERWFQNVVAAFQAADGAPRLYPRALEASGVGDVVATSMNAVGSGVGKFFSARFLAAGSARLTFTVWQGSGSTANVIVGRTGIAAGDTTLTTVQSYVGNPQTYTVDVTFGRLETIFISGAANCQRSGVTLKTDEVRPWLVDITGGSPITLNY